MKILHRLDPGLAFPATAESRFEALYRTLSTDIGPISGRMKESMKTVRFKKVQQRLRANATGDCMNHGAASAIVQHIQSQLYGRDVFVTQRGHLVLGPWDAQEGDTVCVLLGGDVPFVLRPESEGFRLLGECYVDGIMDGEAMDIFGEETYEDFNLM